MASDENVNRNSCVYDPNFAIVCSFFEKFSSLCGIKHPTFSDLQQMLDSEEEISPELIDLHIRLMRKAKKNVNPERWQRTLAKFCYLYYPQDSWELEQHGYNKLDFTQRLKLLLCICEAQFDYNIKFKTDVNKLPINELRLSPIGTDKDGVKYWIHTDEKLDLKVYKENSEEETFDLIATDRDGLLDLIETLRSERDPNRKFEEEPSEEEDDSDEEVEEEEEEEEAESETEGEDENIEEEGEKDENADSSLIKNEPNVQKSTTEDKSPEESIEKLPTSESQSKPVSSNTSTAEIPPLDTSTVKEEPSVSVPSPKVDVAQPKKPHVDIKSRRFDKSPEIKLRKEKVVCEPTPKQLKPEEFAQHIEKLKSEKILLPLLASPLPFPESPRGTIDSLKTKINMKFNMIKPVLTNEVLMSKIEEVKNSKDLYKKVVVKREDNSVNNYVLQMNKSKEATSRAGKPGLKLEQILKSKLAQKLAANDPASESNVPSVKPTALETPTSNEIVAADTSKTEPSSVDADQSKNISTLTSQPSDNLSAETAAKRKLSQEIDVESKKAKLENVDPQPTDYTNNSTQNEDKNTDEIEEPLMLVTGVGSGAECQSGNCFVSQDNDDDREEREFVLFVNGTGSGVDCNSPNEDDDDEVEKEFCLFISGPGSGVECLTGNNETTAEEPPNKEKPPATLTHKVENILSSKTEVDEDQTTTSVSSSEETPKKVPPPATDDSAEKKKPKLWTIDAICNSDSSKDTTKKEDISCFPNFSFNKDKKPDMSYRNEFSFFNMPRSESKENDSVPTNFYFGSDTQIPPYVATDVRNANNVKATKSHNVKDIVQLDRQEDKQEQAQVYSNFTNSHSEQAFNLCTRQSSPTIAATTESSLVKGSETVYSNVMSLSTSNEVVQNQNELKNSTDAINSNDTSSPISYSNKSHESDLSNNKTEPHFITNSSIDFVEDKIPLRQEEQPVITKTIENVSASETLSEKNKNLESFNEIDVSAQESKPVEVLTKVNIPVVNKPVATEESTPSNNEKSAEDVPDKTHVEPEPIPDLSRDTLKESIEPDSCPESNFDKTHDEKSQSQAICETDLESHKDIKKSNLVEPEVEKPIESLISEESVTIQPIECVQESQPIKETLSKSERIQDTLSEPQTTEQILPETQSTLEAVVEPPPVMDEAKEAELDSLETDKVVSKVVEPAQQPAESVDLKNPVVESIPKKVNDQTDKPLSPGFESPESDNDYTAAPSPPSPEPTVENEPAVEPASVKLLKPESFELANVDTPKTEIKTDTVEKLEKITSLEQSPEEPIEEKSTPQTEDIQKESEPAIKPASPPAPIAEPEHESESKSENITNESLPTAAKTSPTPEQEPLKDPEPTSEQITEQNIIPSEDTAPTEDEPKSNEETTPAAEVTTPTPIPEKKSKKSKLSSEETSTPAPVLRTSSRISTRSTRKDSVPKKDVEEEEEDKKSAKITPSKIKQAEVKTAKKGKAAAKSTKQTAADLTTPEPAVDQDNDKDETPTEPFTTPVTSKYVKKAGKGRRKWGRGAKTTSAKTTPVKAPSTEASSDENEASEDEEKSIKEKVADKEPKSKTPSKVTPKKEKEPKKSDGETDKEAENEQEKKSQATPKSTPTKKKTGKRGWFTELDVSNMESTASATPIRQSRRIAQLKIKEQAEGKYVDQITPTKKAAKVEAKSKQQVSLKKNNKTTIKKSSKSKIIKEDSDGDDSSYERSTPSKKKRKKKDPKKKVKVGNVWKAGSESSSEEEAEEDDHFEEDEDDEEIVLNDASDHEFSPESDLEDADFQPVKRARTAHSKPKTEEDKSEKDDLCCQKCRTAEQPEWILLCDKCDEGWHASCLRPPLSSIPEGDWFCPHCQHNMLINSLHKFLKTYDKKVKKRDNDELRRQRMQYVGISTTNIIADFSKIASASDEASAKVTGKKREDEAPSDDRSSDEEDESEGDEPLYTLRVRRQANVSYTLKEYDEIMNSAIQTEVIDEEIEEAAQPAPATEESKPDAEAVVAKKPEVEESYKPEDKDEEESSEEDDEEDETKEEKNEPVVPSLFRNIRKKPARLTKLDVSSDDDHFSDEDFKGSSADDYDEDEYGKSETDSDEARYRRSIREPVRRSTRARVTRYDNDFINDDDSEEEDFESKKKKKKSRNSDSDSEQEDSTWGKRKRTKYSRVHRSTKKKKRRRVVFQGDSEEEKERKEKKVKKSRITYGLEVEEDDYPQRRTRGKKINYLENLGSDSEEEDTKPALKSRKILSDDDDDYVNEEDDNDGKKKTASAKVPDDDDGEVTHVAEAGAGDLASKDTVLENGTKNDSVIGDCGDGIKKSTDTANLRELITTTNNSAAIKTYSKTAVTGSPNQKQIKTEAVPVAVSSSDAKNDLAAANKLAPPSPSTGHIQIPPNEPLQVFSSMVTNDDSSGAALNKGGMPLKKIDSTNPSLEGMQSMAQSIPQMMSSPSNYSMARKMVPMPGGPDGGITGAQYPPANPYADVGIAYEDGVAEGLAVGPPPPTAHPSGADGSPHSLVRGVPPPSQGSPVALLGPPEGARLASLPPSSIATGPPGQLGPRPQLPPTSQHMPPAAGGPPMYMGPRPGGLGPMGPGPGMGPMRLHNPMMQRVGPMPPMQMSPQMMAAMHMRGARPPQPPPGSVGAMPPMMNQSAPSPNQPIETIEPAPKKRGARGKGKKQLEQERLKREAETAAAAAAAAAGQESSNPAGDEMIPLHMLKPLPSSDMNPAAGAGPPTSRPGAPPSAGAPYNSSSPQNFANYPPPPGTGAPGPGMGPRLPYSTASTTGPGAVTVSVGNNPSKRVKITPTRMRMPGSGSQNVMRFPARTGQPPQMMHHLPLDPSPSGGGVVVSATINSSISTSAEHTPPNTSAAAAAAAAAVMAAEMDAKKRPPPPTQPAAGSEQQPPQQYYQPPSYPPLPAGQMPRGVGGFNTRPEFAAYAAAAAAAAAARKPMPPYSHPPGPMMVTTGAPTTVISRSLPSTTNTTTISGPMPTPATTVTTPASGKSDPAAPQNSGSIAPATATTTTTVAPPYSVAPPYIPATAPSSIASPTSKPAATTAPPTVAAISTTAGAVPSPASGYQTLHMKQLPPQASHSVAPPYSAAPPFYAVAPIVPNSYPRPPAAVSSAYGPPPPGPPMPPGYSPSIRPPAGFGKSPPQQQPTPPYGAAPPPSHPPNVSAQDAATASGSIPPPPPEYQTGAQQQADDSGNAAAGFQQYQEPVGDDGQFQAAAYDEDNAPAPTDEQPSGEFGGLVSYFSSQREDDLDA